MDYEKELSKQYEECENSGYFFFVPEQSLYPIMDLLLKDGDILLLKPINFKKSYFELIEKNARSPAGDDDGVVDRTGMK